MSDNLGFWSPFESGCWHVGIEYVIGIRCDSTVSWWFIIVRDGRRSQLHEDGLVVDDS